MNAIRNKSRALWHAVMAAAVGLVVALPLNAARADDDDDWEDRWEDYQEELEDEREEARERWEERHEDREDALEDWRERHGRHRYYRPDNQGRTHRYRSPRYYEYRSGPVHETYFEEPRYYRYQSAPRYRYYGTPDVGYAEFGRRRSVQIGPVRVYWDRD